MAVACFAGLPGQSFALPFDSNNTLTEKYLPVSLTDWSGIAAGAGQDGWNPRTYFSDAAGTLRDDIRPRVSAKGEGADDSYALLLGGESSAVTRYETSLAFSGVGVLSRRINYTISMKIKRKAGAVTALKLGIMEATAESYELTVGNHELSDTWTEFTFTYTTGTQSNSATSRLLFSYTAPEGGATLLIDDIVVHRTDGGSQANLFEIGNFDTLFWQSTYSEEHEEGSVYAPYGIESLQHQYFFGFDADFDDEIANFSVENNAGIAESYAAKLTGDGENHLIFLRFQSVGFLKNNTEYMLGFKVRKTGTVNKLSLGVVEQWNAHTALSFSAGDTEEYITEDAYSYYKVKYTTTSECSGAWNYLMLSYNIADGAVLYIDDVECYPASDTNKANLYPMGKFDFSYFGGPVDNTPEAGAEFLPCELSDYDPVPNYGASDHLKNNTTASIVPDEGVKGSYALKLAGNDGKLTAHIKLGTAPGYFTNGTEYMFVVRVKKTGAISSLSLGYTSDWRDYTALELAGSAFSDEYAWYGAKLTTEQNCTASWQHLWISFTGSNGSQIYIDDIEVYKTSDETPANLFPKGSFDYKYYKKDFDNIPDSSNYIPRDIDNYSTKGYFFGFDASAETNIHNVSVVNGKGVKNSAAFKIVGDGEKHQIFFRFSGLNALENNTDYMLGFKVKKETLSAPPVGAAKAFGVGLTEQWNTHVALNFSGTNFDRCITDEYNYYQVKYTTTNECFRVWSYCSFEYEIPVGTVIYLDDIEVVPLSGKNTWICDTDGNAMNIFPDGGFEMKNLGQDTAKWCDMPAGQTPKMEFYVNKNYIDGTLAADVAACSDAISGNYCLSLGFNPQKAYDSEYVDFIFGTLPGKSYKISFWIKICGEVESVTAGIVDGMWVPHEYPVSLNRYEYGKWTKVEFIYKDNTTIYTSETYRYFTLKFKAPAGSGVLLDSLSAREIGSGYETANLMGNGNGNFEEFSNYPNVTWSDRFTHKKGK